MSQQEMMPEPQSNNKQQSGNEEDTYAQPYYWSTQPEDAAPQPKEEPASSYDEPLTQNDYTSGYQSQNEMTYSYPENKASAKAASDFSQTQGQQGQQQQQQQFQSQQGRNPYSPDGDAFETGYDPYNTYNVGNSWQTRQSVPFWARPQKSHYGGFRWLWFVVLAFMFMGPLLHIVGNALFFLFPLLFVGLIIFASAVFWSTIGPRRPRGPGNPNSWRSPWGW